MYKKLSTFIFLAAIVGIVSIGFFGRYDDGSVRKTNTNDNYKYIAINQVLMWVSNNGDGSHDPRTDGNGFYWPGGENATRSAVFEDGLIWGGKIGREIRMNGNTHRQGLQAGRIIGNEADDPGNSEYRVYRIRKGWENLPPGTDYDNFKKDYEEWPMEMGAPYVDVDGSGDYTDGDIPNFIGDEVLWYVANDMDPSRSTFTYGTLPMGLEFQTTIFAFNRTGDLGDIVFKKYTILNKGNNTIRDMIVGMWSDTDLGNAGDDCTGCDLDLSLGYTWNGDNDDESGYGSPPPADGYDFFQGPVVPSDDPLAVELGLPDSAKFLGKWRKGISNLPMTAFVFYLNPDQVYRDPSQGIAQGSVEFYNYLNGLVWDGNPFIDPNTGQTTKLILSGDPVAGTGWYMTDGWPGGPDPQDVRHVMASGPFTMAPGDTQEVVVGILIAQGTSNLNSITELKRKDEVAQIAYDLDFNLTEPPHAPQLSAYTDDQIVTFYWDSEAEAYDAEDPLILGKGFSDTTYTFQGYRLWQFADATGADPQVIGTWDITDDIKVIYNQVPVNGFLTLVPEIVLANEGLQNFFTVTSDVYTNSRLLNGTPYYFGVSAIGYSPNSVPTYLESPPVAMEVIPARKKIDYHSDYVTNQGVRAEKKSGLGDGKVIFKVLDPEGLTGDNYRVEIGGTQDSMFFSLFDQTLSPEDTLVYGDTHLIKMVKDEFNQWMILRGDTLGAKIYDGFQLMVQNEGADSLATVVTKYRMKDVMEVNGPGGTSLSEPVDVWDHYNSTESWQVVAKGLAHNFIWQSSLNDEGLGYDTYEIRFTGTSQYYVSGYAFSFTPLTKDDSLGEGTLPFEVWDLGRTDSDTDDVRLVIKVLDQDRTNPSRVVPDMKWTRLPNGDWEEIFAYYDPDFPADSLPTTSGRSKKKDHKWGEFSFRGPLPEAGTVIRMHTWAPMEPGTVFEATMNAADLSNDAVAAGNIDKISVFPNPYFGSNDIETDKYHRIMRFIGLPTEVTLRIYSLSGVFVRKMEKDDNSQFMDWNLLNKDNLPVASGIYLAYLDMPGVGTKIMKLAIIQEQQYIDRL